MIDKLSILISKCKFGISVYINVHKSSHQSVETWFDVTRTRHETIEQLGEKFDKMQELDSIVFIHFYPQNSDEYVNVLHYDLEKAIDECLTLIDKK